MVAIVPAGFPTKVPQKYLLHPGTLLPLTPWIIVISAMAATPSFDVPAFTLWLGIHTVTLFAAGFVGLGFSELLRRRGKTSLGFWWVVSTGALVGLVKASTTIASEEILGLSDAPAAALAARAVGGVLVGMWLITLVAYGKTALDSVQQAREALIRQNVAQRLAGETSVASPEVHESLSVISRLRDDLQHHPDKVSPASIRLVVDSTIRPLSRALWAVESRRYPPLKLVSLYRIALRSLRLRAWLVALVWAVTSFTALAVPAGIVNAAVYTAIGGSVAVAAFHFVRLGWTRSVVVSLIVVTLTSLGSVSLGFVITALITGTELQAADVPVVITGAVWMSFVVIGASILSGVVELRDVIREDLGTSDTRDVIRRRSADDTTTASTKLVAAQLHGSVQSGLLGVALALDRGMISSDEIDQRLAAIVDELQLLGSAHSDHADGDKPPHEVVADLIDNWAGLLAVEVDNRSTSIVQTLLESRPECADILREALTNAHRHGRATEVTIHATTHSDGDVTLTVVDNGYGPRIGSPGLGSTLLDAWTRCRWTLTPHPDGGSALQATITPSDQSELPQ